MTLSRMLARNSPSLDNRVDSPVGLGCTAIHRRVVILDNMVKEMSVTWHYPLRKERPCIESGTIYFRLR